MRTNSRTSLSSERAGLVAGLAVASLFCWGPVLHAHAQDATTPPPAPQSTANPDSSVTGNTQVTTDAQGQKTVSTTLSVDTRKKKSRVAKDDRVKQSKDTRREVKTNKKLSVVANQDAQLPDKQLYDKALAQEKSGHFDVARLDLQTLLNTYPDSQYQMRAKLAVADCWYKEGGSAALIQAEQEYGDFITFFPNAPEASEAQMRIGDIYFKQMDVPDRDYAKAEKAEAAYRTMLKQYPDAPPKVTAEATQKLREVQEVLATREAELAAFYATHLNWPATIARYQTVIDTYPQYSHMDDALIGVGDAYEAEAQIVRTQKLPEGARAALLTEYDGKAADAYRRVVLEHAAAPHVEDAKERLAAMNLPIPTPTPEQVAASEALESSRAQYTMSKRLQLLFMHKPDTVTAAGAGAPPLDDPPATTAPQVIHALEASYVTAFNPNGAHPAPAVSAPSTPAAEPSAEPAPPVSTAPPTLSDVPAAGASIGDSSTSTMTEAAPTSGGSGVGSASVGVEVLTPGVSGSGVTASGVSGSTAPAATPDRMVGAPASDLPAATGAADPNYGLKAATPANNTALPPIEKPADAPDQVNEAAGQKEPPAQTKTGKKNPKAPAVDKNDESSSKKKKKKGLDKLNPF